MTPVADASEACAATAELEFTPAHAEAPAVETLRLRRVSSAQASVLARIFGGHDTVMLAGDRGMSWLFTPAPDMHASAVLLRNSTADVSLAITADRICDTLGPCEWWDYQGESRLLAWTVAHTQLLGALEQILQEPLLPVGWCELAATPESSTNIECSFVAQATDGRSSSGVLSLPLPMAERLGHTATTARRELEALGRRLTGRLQVLLQTVAFPSRELIAAQIGDVLVLGQQERCWCNLKLVYVPGGDTARPGMSWDVRYEADRFEICGTACEGPVEANLLTQTTADDTTTASNPLAAIPVLLEFEVGNLSLSLAELAALKPGYVFQLANRVVGAQVGIRANGTRIGQGELVAVGDVLGVQLLALDTHGLR
jgi:flagellar motor switch/type III secretory pathway protein FliN